MRDGGTRGGATYIRRQRACARNSLRLPFGCSAKEGAHIEQECEEIRNGQIMHDSSQDNPTPKRRRLGQTTLTDFFSSSLLSPVRAPETGERSDNDFVGSPTRPKSTFVPQR